MIRAFTYVLRPTRLRTCVIAILAVLAGASCGSSDPLSPSSVSDAPAVTPTAAPSLASVTYSGLPFGPVGLWNTATTVSSGPAPFTFSQNYTDANSIVTQINAARTMKQRLVLAMTGGPASRYTTNGKFDFTKWKNKMNTFNTTTIRNAVAGGVSDGTIIANQLIDEPETARWGGNITKSTIDQMASYAKNIFPSLAMGINHGPPGYKWRTSETYHVLDYVLYQYNYWITSGDIASWRDAVLNRAKIDGVTPALSLNVLDGGIQDRSGTWDCTGSGQAGKGTYYPNCRMTATQVKNWGLAIAGSGCFMMMWQYDDAFMSRTDNKASFKSIADYTATKSRRSCSRP
jgi:hypothetical protein